MKALVLTCVIETVLFILVDWLYTKRIHPYGILIVLLVNTVSNPVLNFAVWNLGIHDLIPILLSEGTVVLLEGFMYMYFGEQKRKNSILMSFLLNGASFLLGGFL